MTFARIRPALRAPVVAALATVALAAPPSPDDGPPRLAPAALVETEPVPHEGDAADDPAIWIHPADPARSLVLGTDKKGGLCLFDLDGKLLQVASDGARPNNVDVIYGFPLAGRAKPVDLAVAGVRNGDRPGLAFWSIDPETRRLAEVGPVPAFPVFGGGEPYGSCVYRSPRDGVQYVFVTNKAGDVEQHRIEPAPGGTIRGAKVRTIAVGSQVEGCVADPEHGRLYVAEEDVAIWCYGAEPDSGPDRRLVARVGEHGLVADLEGLALYRATGGKGYLIASVQGASTFAVFERDGDNAFVATIAPAAGSIPAPGETDGLDVTSLPTSPRFPAGLLVVQDGLARGGRQNFKFYSWADVAGDRLRIDTAAPARPRSR